MAENKGTYYIRTSCPSVPSYAESGGGGLNMDSVKWMLSNLDPGHVEQVGQTYLAASDALTTAADRLHQHAQRVVDAWSGENADAALKQLGQLNTTAAELQEKSAATGQTYSWLGSEILPWYKNEGQKMGHGLISDSGDDKAALELLDRMDNRILQGYNSVPESISKDLPPASKDWGYQGTDGGHSPGGPGTDGAPFGSSPGGLSGGSTGQHDPGPGGLNSGIPTSPGGDATGQSGAGTGLPGTGGGGLPGTGGGTDIAGVGGGGAGGLGGGPSGLGGGAGGVGGGPSGVGGGLLGPGATGPVGPGRGGPGTLAGESAAARAAAGRPGQAAPMGAGAGHGGKEEEERERTTWLTEDEDIWTDGGDIAPPVIE